METNLGTCYLLPVFVLLLCLWLIWNLSTSGSSSYTNTASPPRRQSKPNQVKVATEPFEAASSSVPAFMPPPSSIPNDTNITNSTNGTDLVADNTGTGVATDMEASPLQTNIVEFSDVLLTPEDRERSMKVDQNMDQVQTVNERFDAAKRKTAEHRLTPGVYTKDQRRKIVETLLRRPACVRRVRSWRTENSDILRGDVIPKTVDGWGVLKIGGHNPSIDLHPGALGPMSGMEGQWLSDENVPSNLFDDEDAGGLAVSRR